MYLVEDRLTTGLKTGKAGDVKKWISNARKKLREGFMKHWQKIVAGAVVVIGAAIAAIVLNEKRKEDSDDYSRNDDELHVKVAKKMRGAYTAMKEFFKSLFTKTGRELAKARRKNFKSDKKFINKERKYHNKQSLDLAKKGNTAGDWKTYADSIKKNNKNAKNSLTAARTFSRNMGRDVDTDEYVGGSTSWERIWATILGAWMKIKSKLRDYEFFKVLFDEKDDSDMNDFIKRIDSSSKGGGLKPDPKIKRSDLMTQYSDNMRDARADAAKRSFAQFDYLMEETIAQTVHFNEEVERGLYEGRSLMESAFEVDTSVYEEADLVAEAVAIVFEEPNTPAYDDFDAEDQFDEDRDVFGDVVEIEMGVETNESTLFNW